MRCWFILTKAKEYAAGESVGQRREYEDADNTYKTIEKLITVLQSKIRRAEN